MSNATKILPPVPQHWSSLTWRQLADCWESKIRFGSNPDAAACAALLSIEGISPVSGISADNCSTAQESFDSDTGEYLYRLTSADGVKFVTTPRELSHLSSQTMQWFQYPYGDRGEDAVKDDKGKVIKEGRDPVMGYVNPNWHDAMQLPETEIVVCSNDILPLSEFNPRNEGIHFLLPDVACNNLTWHQYRTLQGLTPMLFRENISDDEAIMLQAQFLSAILVPEQVQERGLDPFAATRRFHYNTERAEQSVAFWKRLLQSPSETSVVQPAIVLYHICFQAYQTGMRYYEAVFPLLFANSGNSDPLRDALTGEVGTINTVMKYAGYADQQQVYDSNLPFVLDILNTMSKEAKEIERINSRTKKH